MSRVVITGIGVVSPLGNDTRTTWANLLAGASGAGTVTLFDADGSETRIACEAKGFDPADIMTRKEARQTDRYIQFALSAALQAIESAKLEIGPHNAEQVATLIGSGYGGISTLSEQMDLLRQRGPSRVSPFLVPMMVTDMGAAKVSITLGAKGPAVSITSSCCSGVDSIGEGAELIRRGDVAVAIVGGAEACITPIMFAGFNQAGALSTKRNHDPRRASRPFDADRDGFVMGEGACVMVLEELSHAEARGAPILAELAGFAFNADAYHITHPAENGEGAVRAIRIALRKAEMEPSRLSYINAHGTSTPINDREETKALKTALGEWAYKIPISSTKSMHGHLLGAGGALEAAICVLAIHEGVIPPTMNLETPDPDCDLDYTPYTPRRGRVPAALSTTFGFGGHNTVLIFKEFAG